MLNFPAEEESVPGASDVSYTKQPKRTNRKNKRAKFQEPEDDSQAHKAAEVENEKPDQVMDKKSTTDNREDKPDAGQPLPELPAAAASVSQGDQSLSERPAPEVVVSISAADRLSAENARSLEGSPGRTATKMAIASVAENPRRSSVALKLRRSVAGLRHSRTLESIRRASRQSMLKRKVSRANNSQCSSKEGEDSFLKMGSHILHKFS